MADWKTQINYNYNYNASYHAYAYGLMYQSGHDQNHLHVTGWSEGGPSDFNNYTPGMTQVYYAAAAAAARTREESPPHSPEQRVANGHCHYQTSSLVYLDECQAGRLQAAGTPRADYETPAAESRKAVSDSTSDSEAHASPDSWSFSSGRESGLPQADPGAWVEKDPGIDPNSSRSPDAGDHVSSSLMEELPSCNDMGDHNALTFSLQAPLLAPNKLSTNAGTPKGKVRVSFSESQMNALVQRFSVQRYLTPAEMKNLAELTGLTYKQVKTWFQNRRMKLRRHQKDNNWVSERYTTTTPTTTKSHSQAVTNHAPLYQAESQRPPLKEHYNHAMMEPAFKKTSPPNLAFYLARMGNSAASAPYSTWSAGAPQAAMAARSQAVGWSVPPGINQYDYYPPGVFHSTEPDTSLGGKDAGSVSGHNAQNRVIVHDMGQ